MRRAFAAVFLFVPVLAPAAEPTKPGGRVDLLVARIDGDLLTSTAVSTVNKSVVVTDKDGGTKTILVKETVTTTTGRELSLLRATDAAGKEIPAADLKAKLKDGGLVAFLSGPLDAEWRKKFKAGVVFVEYAAPKEDKEEKKGEEKK